MRTTVASVLAVAVAAAAAVTLAACSRPATPVSMVPAGATPRALSAPGSAGAPMAGMAMPGMTAPRGGLASSADGFTLVMRTPALPAAQPGLLRFQVTNAGQPVTAYMLDQTKLMHLYLIRSDLTGFQHVHPVLAPDGTWTARLAAHQPGSYRVFASFIAANATGRPVPLVLSAPVTIPGTAILGKLPPPSPTAIVDGYTLTLSGRAMAGMVHTLNVVITRDRRPVTSLQPYLGSYAHLTAFRQGNLAFAHLHPAQAAAGDHGGPGLTFHTMFTQPGSYRLFLQFKTAGIVHTAAFTLPVS